jgi:hypothetical protein
VSASDFHARQDDLRWLRERDRRPCPVVNLARYRAVEGAVNLAASRRKVTELTRRAAVALALSAFKYGDSAAMAVSRAYRVLAPFPRRVP